MLILIFFSFFNFDMNFIQKNEIATKLNSTNKNKNYKNKSAFYTSTVANKSSFEI